MNLTNLKEKIAQQNTSLQKRSKEEIILLLMCALSIPSILPFAIFRLFQHNWVSATLDFFIVGGVFSVLAYVWLTGRFRVASVLVTIFYSTGMVIAVKVNGINLIYWTYPTMISAYFMLRPNTAVIINAFSLSALIFILMSQVPLLNLLTIIITFILINLFSYIFSHRTRIQHRELNLEAERDFLTRTGNRRALDAHLARYLSIADGENVSCMLLLDIDHFKRINDAFGHPFGDQVLVRICDLLRTRTRATDKIFRYGGEEFIIVAGSTNIKSAASLAEELRQLVAETTIIENYSVTISIGVTSMSHNRSVTEWLSKADEMLYLAKQSGRNLVKVAT